MKAARRRGSDTRGDVQRCLFQPSSHDLTTPTQQKTPGEVGEHWRRHQTPSLPIEFLASPPTHGEDRSSECQQEGAWVMSRKGTRLRIPFISHWLQNSICIYRYWKLSGRSGQHGSASLRQALHEGALHCNTMWDGTVAPRLKITFYSLLGSQSLLPRTCLC